MTIRSITAAIALSLGASANAAQGVSASLTLPCVNPAEAESLVTAVLPETVEALSATCAKSLPPAAFLGHPPADLIARYRADADAAWPQAQKTVSRIAGADLAGLLGNNLARPVLASLLAPAISRQVQPGECPAYDRIVALSAPLPPRNLAGLLVAAWQIADARRPADDKRGPLRLCARGS